MELERWNETLALWFLPKRPGERVYLRSDDAEFDRLSTTLALGLKSPAEDLVNAVQDAIRRDPALRWLSHQGELWRKQSKADEFPPWLAILAVSVLVVAREAERGSLAFYEPFSTALGLPIQFTQDDYEASLYRWWVDLARWLTDINFGERGLPTWSRIPSKGPRSIIGHPYTQVMLRREDLSDLDTFLASCGALSPGDFEVTDQGAAAADLLARLTRWAQTRKISSRLYSILFGSDRQAADSLQWMLLDRLLDEVATTRVHAHDREGRLVVSLDDWDDRQLRLSVLLPSALNSVEGKSISLGDDVIGPIFPGEPHVVPIALDGDLLTNGHVARASEGLSLVYRSADVVVLVAREWSLWHSVDDADPGEMAYLLISNQLTPSLSPSLLEAKASGITGVPTGWSLYGPMELPTDESTMGIPLPLGGEVQALPRLVGGLEIARHAYLVGGPPAIWLPSASADVALRVDGQPMTLAAQGSLAKLSEVELGEGEHHVDLGPYRLSFELLAPEKLPTAPGSLVRTALGVVVLSDQAAGSATYAGASRTPVEDYDPVILCPLGSRVVVLGGPGFAFECTPSMAKWALFTGLPQTIFEPNRRSSYAEGERPFKPILWVAVKDSATSTWSVTQVSESSAESSAGLPASDLARSVSESVGRSPRVLRCCSPDASAEVASSWVAYVDLISEIS